jgi:hypothetical protein
MKEPTGSQSKEKEILNENKEEEPSKFIRLLTVGFYLGALSFVASMLSFYYVFLWDSLAAVRDYEVHQDDEK